MPAMLHEGLVLLFRRRPKLAAELLARALGKPLSPRLRARVADAAVPQLVSPERHADLVVVLSDAGGRPVLGIVVEVQLRVDRRKLRSWPLYAASLHAKLGCDVRLVVVTPRARVAAWARRPIATLQPRSPFVPEVLGPDAIPRVTEVAAARRAPEQAVISALAHGNEPGGLEVAVAALRAAAALDRERAVIYHDIVYQALGEAARRALEGRMDLRGYVFQSDFIKKNIAIGEAKGVARGRAEGEARGRAEGEARGRAEGEVKAKTKAVLAVLEARGIALSRAQHAQLAACTDSKRLDAYIARAAVAESADEVVRPSRRKRRVRT